MALNQLVALDTGSDAFSNAFNNTGNALVNRQTNQLRQQQLDMQNQKQSIDIANQQRVQQLRPQIVAGNQDALAEAGILNPEFLDKWTKLNADQQALHINNAKIVGNAAYAAQTPEQWDAAVQQLAQTGIISPQAAQQYTGRFDQRQSVIAQNQDLLKRLPLNQSGLPILPGQQGGTQTAAAPAPAAPSSGITVSPISPGAASPDQGDATAALPRGIRNNNPGNIAQSDIQWPGQTQGKDSRFVTFNSPEAGIGALAQNLMTYQEKHGLNTVAGIVNRWAPPSENNTGAYVNNVAAALGVKPDDKIDLSSPATLTKITKAMISQENGQQPYSDETLQKGIAPVLDKKFRNAVIATQGQPQKPVQTADLSGTTGFQAAANQQAPQAQQQVANLPPNAIMVMGEHGLQPAPGAPDGMVWVSTPQGRALAPIQGLATMKGQQAGQQLTETRRAEAGTPQYIAEQETQLGTQFRGQRVVQERNEAATNYRAALDVAKQATPASDQVLAQTIAKVIDPSAGPNLDAASIMQLQGVGSKLGGIMSKALGGGGLLPAERQQLLEAAQSKMASLEGGYQQEVAHFTGVAGRRGLNVQNIIPDMPVQQSGQQVQYPVPKPAETKGGKGAPPPAAQAPAPAATQAAPEMPSGLPGVSEAQAQTPPQSAFAGMSDADLGKIDKTKMRPDARRQYEDEVLKRRAAIIAPDAVEAELRRRGAIK